MNDNAMETLTLFHHPKDRLRLTMADRSYPTVKPVWAAPLSQPDRYLALLNGKGEQILMLPDPSTLDSESREAVDIELRRRYLTATVTGILMAKVEFGATYWTVETNRGLREFVTESLQENVQWLGDHHLLLIDVDGNRFEIPSTRDLDPRSRSYIEKIL
jgi:hypothetical protein